MTGRCLGLPAHIGVWLEIPFPVHITNGLGLEQGLSPGVGYHGFTQPSRGLVG